MAVPEQTPYKEFTANGITKIFPLDFDILDQDHLVVLVNDLEPTVGSWSLDLINNSVVFALPPANGANIKITRDTPLERSTDYQTYDNSFRPQPVNNDFDRIWWKLQEIWVQITLIWAYVKAAILNLQNQINNLNQDLISKVNELWNALWQETSERKLEDSKIRAWVILLLNNIVDSGLVSAIAVTHVECVEDLNSLFAWDGRTVYIKSYHLGLNKGGGKFVYNPNMVNVNDGGVCINGWVRQLENTVLNPYMFGAYGDLIFGANEVLEYQSGHDDTIAFQKMLNMNKYVVFTNISKAASSNLYCKYTFEIPHGAYYLTNTLPIRSFTKIKGNNSTLHFNPSSAIDLFKTPRSEMIAAYEVSTGWNTQTITMVEIDDLIIIGNISRTSTIHSQSCFDAANAYKWKWTNIIIERFQNGISIYPLDTSSWTNGERIGNFYENVLDNVTINECVQHFYNAGNATQATNLTLAGGYVVGHQFEHQFNYFLINDGAGFSCNGFNIAPANDQMQNKPLIYDGCLGSYYGGGYTEWFSTFFELKVQARMGGFRFDASHIFKYAEHCLFKFKEGGFSKYDYETSARTIPDKFVNGRLYSNYLNQTGLSAGSGGELITNFFKYAPQYDFKYGLYGVEGITDDLIYDVKRFEDIDTGFTTRYGIRLINTTEAEINLSIPLNNQSVMAKIIFLYRPINNFNQDNFKSNVLGFNGTNERISTAELIIDYGNDWKLAVLEVTSEQTRTGNVTITLPPNSQVEIEHIGAYANGYPFMPAYKDYEPHINTSIAEGISTSGVGGVVAVGDILRANSIVNAGEITSSVSDSAVLTQGTYSNRHVGANNVTLASGINTINVENTDTLKRLGIGAKIELQQSGVRNQFYVVGRGYSSGKFNHTLRLKGDVNVVAGNVLFYPDYMLQPTLRPLQYYINNYISRNIPYESVIVSANSIKTTDIILDGVSMGGTALVSVSPSLGTNSRMWAEVTSPGKITVYHQNLTGSSITTPSNMVMTVKVV